MNDRYNQNKNNHCQSVETSSTIVRFEKPRMALVKGAVYQLYGMLFVSSLKEDKEKGKQEIMTFRRPLEGEELRPIDVIDEYDDKDLVFLPENGIIDNKKLKTLVYQVEERCGIIAMLDELNRNNFIYRQEKEELEVYVYSYSGEMIFSSDAFYITLDGLNNRKLDELSPANFIEILDMQDFIKIKMKFSLDDKDCNLVEIINILENWLDKHRKDGILYDGDNITTCNDGEYTYTEELGKIRMTRADFLEKFPDAHRL